MQHGEGDLRILRTLQRTRRARGGNQEVLRQHSWGWGVGVGAGWRSYVIESVFFSCLFFRFCRFTSRKLECLCLLIKHV